ncbi:Lrp/AsnC family transcriptional regulator [Streptomyces sp. NPDC054765]
MAIDLKDDLDVTDWRILAELQENARISFSELGRRIALTPPAVAERVRRLEQRGIIEGYQARLNLDRLGLPILAFVNIRYPTSDFRDYAGILHDCPEVLECHHVTGSDCFVAKVAAQSMAHLEEVTSRIARIGSTTTMVVYSTSVRSRVITEALISPTDEVS